MTFLTCAAVRRRLAGLSRPRAAGRRADRDRDAPQRLPAVRRETCAELAGRRPSASSGRGCPAPADDWTGLRARRRSAGCAPRRTNRGARASAARSTTCTWSGLPLRRRPRRSSAAARRARHAALRVAGAARFAGGRDCGHGRAVGLRPESGRGSTAASRRPSVPEDGVVHADARDDR